MHFDIVITVTYLACAALLLIVSFLIYRENTHKNINRITGLMFGFAALGPLFFGLGSLIGDTLSENNPLYNLQYIWELFFPQLILFSMIFPIETNSFKRWKRLKYIIFLPHIFHLLLTTVFSNPDTLLRFLDPKEMGTIGRTIFEPIEPIMIIISAGFSLLLDSHIKLFSTVNFSYTIIAAVILYRGIQRVTAPQLRKQILVVIYGLIAALTLYVIAFTLPNLGVLTLTNNIRHVLTLSALLLGCGSIVWAILRYRFMNVKLIVRQSLVYTVTSAFVVGIYLLIIRQIEQITSSIFGVNIPGLDIVLIIVALMLFQPVMSQLDDLIRRFFIKDKADYRNISENFSSKVATMFDTSELFALTFNVLKNQMLFESVQICVKSSDEASFGFVAEGGEETQRKGIRCNNNFIDELQKRRGVINYDELASTADKSPMIIYLSHLRIRYVIPLISGEGLLGFIAISDKVSGYRLNYEDITTLSTIANQLTMAMTTSSLYLVRVEKQRLEEEMNFARKIQRDLQPKTFPSGDDFHFSAYTEPSREVGGDYFDFIKTPRDTYGIVVADVTGKGVSAALLASQLQAAIRTEVKHEINLAQMLANVNDLVHEATSSDRFATLFYAEYEPKEKRLSYVNAGHNYPIVISENNGTTTLETGGLLLGAFPNAKYSQDDIKLTSNDVVFFYTDGLNEAENKQDEQYGEERIIDLLHKKRSLSANEIQHEILKDVRKFTAERSLQDDLTLIVLKVD